MCTCGVKERVKFAPRWSQKAKKWNNPYPKLSTGANKAITEPGGGCLFLHWCTCSALLGGLLLLLPHLIVIRLLIGWNQVDITGSLETPHPTRWLSRAQTQVPTCTQDQWNIWETVSISFLLFFWQDLILSPPRCNEAPLSTWLEYPLQDGTWRTHRTPLV